MKNFNRKDKIDREKRPHRDWGKDSEKPAMHKTTCSKCGKPCEVPFKPTGSKPIYCSDCYIREPNEGPRRSGFGTGDRPFHGKGHSERNFADKYSDRPSSFTAVCDACGAECEVPYRPKRGKPVYCADCFEKNDHSKNSGVDAFRKELETIQFKLDQILKLLTRTEAETGKEEPKAEKKTKKAAAAKPAVKKASTAKKKTAAPKTTETDEPEG